MNESDEWNSSGSSDFFSPTSSSFSNKHHHHHGASLASTPNSDRLPPLHDSSWIGARLSPIRSFDREEMDADDEDHEDDDHLGSPSLHHKTLHELLEEGRFQATESTSLLRNQRRKDDSTSQPVRSHLHPLWNSPVAMHAKVDLFHSGRLVSCWTIVMAISGLQLLSMAVYDVYRWHDYSRDRPNDSESDERNPIMWSFPVLTPSKGTLLLIGAWAPIRVSEYGELWRLASSVFLPTSVVEWVLAGVAWQGCRQQHGWTLLALFVCCVWIGQLWTLAWEDQRIEVVTGCLSWGTCGVSCATGMAYPSRRFCLFMSSVVFVVLAVWTRPYSSVIGVMGSALFGWAVGAAFMPYTKRPKNQEHYRCDDAKLRPQISAALAIFMCIVPVFWISFTM